MAKRNSRPSSPLEAALKWFAGVAYGVGKAIEAHQRPDPAPRKRPSRKPRATRKCGSACWWKVLGVTADASPEEIRKAYRARIVQSHPDKVAHLSPALQEAAEQETKRLNEALDQAMKQ